MRAGAAGVVVGGTLNDPVKTTKHLLRGAVPMLGGMDFVFRFEARPMSRAALLSRFMGDLRRVPLVASVQASPISPLAGDVPGLATLARASSQEGVSILRAEGAAAIEVRPTCGMFAV